MASETKSPRVVQFGAFEVDLQTRELRKSGVKLRIHDQPFQILAALVDRPGEIITRDALRKKLWPTETFVDFDHSINTAVNKVRELLGDSAEHPRFIETLPRRGYRFLAPVKVLANHEELKEESEAGKLTSIAAPLTSRGGKSRRMWTLAGTAVLLISVITVEFWFLRPRSHPISKTVPLTSYPGRQVTPAFSPDGKQVAFVWDGEQGGNFHIYLKLVILGPRSGSQTNRRMTTHPPGRRTVATSHSAGIRESAVRY